VILFLRELPTAGLHDGARADEVFGLVAEMTEVRTIWKLHERTLSIARCPHLIGLKGFANDDDSRLGFYPFRGPDASLTHV
jgi:hypothetical protein